MKQGCSGHCEDPAGNRGSPLTSSISPSWLSHTLLWEQAKGTLDLSTISNDMLIKNCPKYKFWITLLFKTFTDFS